jgi:hypothetical protein
VWTDENPHGIRHHQQWEFSINLWAGILGDCLTGPLIFPKWVGGTITFIFFEHTTAVYWKICPSVSVFARAFSTKVLHDITIVKFVNGYPKIILEAGSVADVTFQFPGLHVHLTWILSYFLLRNIWKPRYMPVHSILEGSCELFKVGPQGTCMDFIAHFGVQKSSCKIWYVMRHIYRCLRSNDKNLRMKTTY